MFKIIFLPIIATFVMSCASKENNAEEDELDPNATASSEVQAPAQSDDLQGSLQENLQESPQDATSQPPLEQPELAPPDAQNPPPPPPENVPEPNLTEPKTAEAESQNSEGPAAKITALDFNSNLNGGTIIIKTNNPVTYTTRKNDATNQFVVELQKTSVPKRFTLPYNTKEFSGPIGSINAYQSKSGDGSARIVVQLRGSSEPAVSQHGKVITIAGTGGTAAAPLPEQAPQDEATEADAGEANGDDTNSTETSTSEEVSEKISDTKQKTLNEFLTGNSKFYGRKISLEVKDADIRDVLRFISEESGINIVVADDVTGKITIKLRNIPWDQALTVVLQSRLLGYVKQGNILRIATLKSLQIESDASRNVIESQRQLEPLRVRLFPLSYAVAKDLELQSKDFLSTRGKARADVRTNTLIVTDIDEVLERIKVLIKKLDLQTPQVLIEAKVVEARESFERTIGIDWGFTGAQQIIGSNSQGQPSTFQAVANYRDASQGPNSGQYNFNFGQLDVFGNLNASLRLLEIENLAKVLSAPRIVTLNGTEAKIEQTTQYPTFTSGVSTTGVSVPQISYQDIKLTLGVKPQITFEGGIIMEIDILREFVDAPITVGGSQSRPKNSRHATTKVLVDNGNTVVIGGIYQSDVSEGNTGIPWLMNLPIIGYFFNTKNITRDKNELVIFLTPKIINREKAFIKPEAG